MSDEWKLRYQSGRSGVEGFNGYLKDSGREALHQAGRRRLRGMAAQYVMTAVLVASANMRKIATFLNEVEQGLEKVLERKHQARERRKRREGGLSKYLQNAEGGPSVVGSG